MFADWSVCAYDPFNAMKDRDLSCEAFSATDDLYGFITQRAKSDFCRWSL